MIKAVSAIAIAISGAIAVGAVSATPESEIVDAVDVFVGDRSSQSVESNQQHFIVALALMQTAAWAEAGWYPGIATDDLYKIEFGGTKFSSYAKHPDTVTCVDTDEGRLCSAAKGAYQFMPATWLETYDRYDYWPVGENGEVFIPQAQDLAFLRLFAETGGWWHLEAGTTVLNGVVSVDDDAIAKAFNAAADVWCSFPSFTAAARGPAHAYSCNDPRQAQKDMGATIQMFNENLERIQDE